jgi:murein DD-endopeptidase
MEVANTSACITGMAALILAIPVVAGPPVAEPADVAVTSGAAHLRQSVDLQVPVSPEPVKTVGSLEFVYELHVTNFAAVPIELTRIEVLDAADGGSVIREFRDADLASLIGRPVGVADADKHSIAPGTRAIVYFEFTLNTPRVPRVLSHRVELDLVQASGREHVFVEGGVSSVNAHQSIALGPPLRGGPWVAVYDQSASRGHRRVVYAINGRARIPGRFAVDWIKVTQDGQYTHDDGSQVANWYGYGAEVLAVADAGVVAARDGIAESSVINDAIRNTLENASGNYVALDLGQGRYAFYEHLMPKSLVVKTGDRVKRGQVIGRLGYTGDSTGPHLHFHVSDSASPLGAEGLPYVIDKFDMLGAYESLEAFSKARPWTATQGTATHRIMEFPIAAAVVDFGR